ncbi:MAG: aminoglycoside phosphotransferase family protein [Candidatus Heimdallarchaeum endolithica]|uniref:Aminoglycoside phosphotransferase family protein n=1 Tax=Candidatus Heimdallarchaeum endolithica TaxID=2876572 RepID=A0A9Y1FQ25_9ARCH|nr:MAG: aminoglycoside phosphotransferase family protein [Candidatus Heimdallarchaeum endolithica]
MILSEKQIELINKKVRIFFHFNSSEKLKWIKMEKGFSNTKFIIKSRNDEPLSVCKIYNNDPIISARKRLQNEKRALELFGGKVAPELIWTDNSTILCYKYIKGKEIINLTNEERKNIEEELVKTIEFVHNYNNLSLKENKEQYSQLSSFYSTILDNYEKMNLSVPKHISKQFSLIRNSLKNLYLSMESERIKISYIHGDLVPLNIIVEKNQVSFIDFEYFRIDIPIFDYLYFNYFADKHQLKIKLPVILKNKEIKNVYTNLIKLLNIYWSLSNEIEL